MYCHASVRWAKAAVKVIECQSDPKTLAMWGKAIGASPGALRVWCRAAHVSARESLYFCRVLRAVCLAQSESWEPENLLDVVDERTLRKLLQRASLGPYGSKPPTVAAFIHRQKFIRNSSNITAVFRELMLRGDVTADEDGAAAVRGAMEQELAS